MTDAEVYRKRWIDSGAIDGVIASPAGCSSISGNGYFVSIFADGSLIAFTTGKGGQVYFIGHGGHNTADILASVGRLLAQLPASTRAKQARECGQPMGDSLFRIAGTIWRVDGDQCDFVGLEG